MRHLAALIALALVLLVSCGNVSILTPASGPGTAYPCGINGVVCPNRMCCNENEVCGGQVFSGCPASMCCFVGDPEESDPNFDSARKPHPQFPARQ